MAPLPEDGFLKIPHSTSASSDWTELICEAQFGNPKDWGIQSFAYMAMWPGNLELL